MGDLKDIMHPSEKLGPSSVDVNRMNAFCSYVKHCGLIDLGFNGPTYTWSNKRFSSAPTYERLDRCLANAEWCRLFPTSSLLHLPMMYSDHAPILLLPTSNREQPKNPFDLKTGGYWKRTFRMLLKIAGTAPPLYLSLTKLVFWLQILRNGADSNPKLESSSTLSKSKSLLIKCTIRLNKIHPFSNSSTSNINSCRTERKCITSKEQKKRWAIKGDRNIDFFHLSIIKRHRKNTIFYLTNPDGTHSTTPDQIAATLTTYFQTIFTSSISHSTNTPFTHSPPSPSTNTTPLPNPDLTNFTYSTPDLTELHTIIKDMRSNATPGPDGLNAAFYKATWSWSKQDIHHLVSTFYVNASLPPELNQTFITLIPKKPNPVLPQDFRPIGLCNVIYKIISKSLADRLKPHLPASISQTQSAFIAGRHISSNVILTQEIIHSFMLKSWTPQAFLLKIDLAKAFDRLEWSFITQSLQRLGFNSHFINLIHTCISTSSLSILVNQQPTSYFYPQRGLRQGCPLSPYLFVIAINELSLRLQEQLTISNLQGVSLALGAPPVHSLLFADDLIICGTASTEEAAVIKNVLYDFCRQSGQTPNLNKSSIPFSHNVPTYIKDQITAIFPVAALLPNTMHLGHPMIFSHKDKNRAYNFIYSKFYAKFATLKENKLNHAGRLQYITSVLSSIPVYYMSTILFSKTFINKIHSIIQKFWWAGVQAENSTNPLAFHSWDDISKPKA
jgi:hypothetical protein